MRLCRAQPDLIVIGVAGQRRQRGLAGLRIGTLRKAGLDPGEKGHGIVGAQRQETVTQRQGLGHALGGAKQADGMAQILGGRRGAAQRIEKGNRRIGAIGLFQRLGGLAAQDRVLRQVAQGGLAQRGRLARIAACQNQRDQPDPSPKMLRALGDDLAKSRLGQRLVGGFGQRARNPKAQRGKPARIALRSLKPLGQINKRRCDLGRVGLLSHGTTPYQRAQSGKKRPALQSPALADLAWVEPIRLRRAPAWDLRPRTGNGGQIKVDQPQTGCL